MWAKPTARSLVYSSNYITVPPIVQSSPLLVRSKGGVGIGIPRYCFVFPVGLMLGVMNADQNRRE